MRQVPDIEGPLGIQLVTTDHFVQVGDLVVDTRVQPFEAAVPAERRHLLVQILRVERRQHAETEPLGPSVIEERRRPLERPHRFALAVEAREKSGFEIRERRARNAPIIEAAGREIELAPEFGERDGLGPESTQGLVGAREHGRQVVDQSAGPIQDERFEGATGHVASKSRRFPSAGCLVPSAAMRVKNDSGGGTARALVESFRPRQWIKNTFVFAALVFAGLVLDLPSVGLALAAFAAFCALSSAVYLLNDLVDRERDRAHPTKRLRPLSSGRLQPSTAAAAAILLTAGGLATSFALGSGFTLAAAGYLALNVTYSAGLKRVVLLDVILIAVGFVIRAIAGALAIDVVISSWLLVCTFFLALFLAIGKRRAELAQLGTSAGDHRTALRQLDTGFLDSLATTVTPCCILSYATYTLASGRPIEMVATVPFVVFGFFRYQYLVRIEGQGDDPTEVAWRDVPLQVTVLLWAITSGIILRSA